MLESMKQAFEKDLINDELPNGTYVAMRVINNVELIDWFKKQGLATIEPSLLHVTIIYSKKYFDYTPKDNCYIEITPEEMEAHLSRLNECVVLKFNNNDLTNKHEEFKRLGGTSDYPTYTAHITISYDASEIDLSKIVRPDFNIVLGNEYSQPIDNDWDK